MTELPLIGGILGETDRLLLDLGYSVWWAQTVEFMILMIVLFVALTTLLGRFVPWVSDALVRRADRLVAPLPALLLAPEWVATTLKVRLGGTPGRVVYGYGDGVLLLVDGVQALLTGGLRILGVIGRFGRPITCLLIVLGFLSWNSGSCVGGDPQTCVSPARHWSQQLDDAAAPR
ncbi:hypothetical protein [Nocardia sp. AG03]|uniref:hypothetical protein n=1 Tax=Nocardia sp. AG03 TaxID=3025312 RepID=UPI00241815A9|nr:hypothetical protein [Nocardia sp. AG03]